MSEQSSPPLTLQDRFAAANDDHGSVWKSLWDDGTYVPWDRGHSSPSLVDLLNDNPQLIKSSSSSTTALVPGCGRGYDVLLFASHGVKSYGLELSSSAVKAAEKNAETSGINPELYTFVTGDFFTDTWQKESENGGEVPETFDVVYDYTFLCALDPSKGLREKWAERMAGLVKTGGVLICLEFPLYKDLAAPGPPWPLREEIYKGLLEGVGFVREMYVTPRRYLEAGEGSDMVSVWRKS